MTGDRRAWIIGGVGALAALAGAWSAWRRHSVPAAPALAAPDANRLWLLRFERPEGGELVMEQWQGKPLLINFWATWCPPCITELPEINRFALEFAQQGGRVLGLAVDRPESVREFLGRVKLDFPIALAGLEGTDIIRRLGNLQGALPYSVMFDARGELRHRKMGQTHLGELQQWAATLRA
ncbi:MAG: TlpA family protein disulfide reductase [Burkholderiaceae bacterium]|jgi:thiol-disulfide isomerase/thioredoxin|nr:TlpA family protein disulfide reductase [Aquabacterium sp.]NUP84655.1 TlpA family protein disulfide reductase [Burkholderiaceae bacterium]